MTSNNEEEEGKSLQERVEEVFSMQVSTNDGKIEVMELLTGVVVQRKNTVKEAACWAVLNLIERGTIGVVEETEDNQQQTEE